ncbi:DUF4041 domain-containing protein [Desulfocapsa sp. AH-315-G09]|nr:DUF4041 domain-containing protein [bacterium AH-315-P11]MBN4065306.1 DUF4041 domain-containing protein [Desulfocapsa sp. AH-315-G09]
MLLSATFILLALLSIALLVYAIRQRSVNEQLEAELKSSAKQNSKLRTINNGYEEQYSDIIDINKELEVLTGKETALAHKFESLKNNYKTKKSLFDKLVKETAIYDEEIELAELGFYKQHYDFDTSEKYKLELSLIKDAQKQLLKQKSAIHCTTRWSVGGSKKKGEAMANRAVRLTARAFNNECDAAISRTRWNNIERMENRIQKAFKAINKLNTSSAVIISDYYLQLKVQELRLTYEYKEKRHQEKVEQAEIKRMMREELMLEKEQAKAIKEEGKYQGLLDKAKTEAEKATGSKLEELHKRIALLDKELKEAHEKSERAKSMAQLTKAGHVYIISNQGSFGEDVYKIGMTRRLEPLDRVKELGDASVPFTFDTHAMIYSENAPQLEKALHKVFNSKRINLVNMRKEFFRVNLEEIESETINVSPNAEFYMTAEAREFKESQAILAQQAHFATQGESKNAFPESI